MEPPADSLEDGSCAACCRGKQEADLEEALESTDQSLGVEVGLEGFGAFLDL